MSTNVLNNSPYLRTTRNFPQEAQPLAVEVNRSYLDIAEKVNDRIIGIYPTSRPIINGESWFVSKNRKQQALRQVYPFTAAGNIPHGIAWASVSFISPNSYGTFTDGTNWYGAIYASSTAIAAQISFYVTSTNIVVLAGAAAPSIAQGYINLEWVSQV
jgi:hypothetical protein